MNSSKTDWAIFTTALVTLGAIAGPLMVWPEAGDRLVDTLYSFLTSQLGVVYIWAGTATLGFVLWLGLGRYGRVVLGTPGRAPSFSTFSWVSMLFCAGVATGILYWGTIEWAHYYVGPPFGVEPRSAEAIEWAATYGMFHWGPTGWAFYCLPTVAIGHAYYVRRQPHMRVSSACHAVLGRRTDGVVGRLLDTLFIVGVLGAAGTSLGFGTPMIAAGLGRLFGVESSFGLQVGVVGLCAALFSASVYLGLERGIQRLSNVNMALTKTLLLFVLFAGPTLFILKMATNSAGLMISQFFRMNTWTDPLIESRFIEDWTVFYWAWWVAIGPFMGIFVARISEGRTIRQIVFGMLGWGSLGCAVYYGILGNYALHLELNGILDVTGLVAAQGDPAGDRGGDRVTAGWWAGAGCLLCREPGVSGYDLRFRRLRAGVERLDGAGTRRRAGAVAPHVLGLRARDSAACADAHRRSRPDAHRLAPGVDPAAGGVRRDGGLAGPCPA